RCRVELNGFNSVRAQLARWSPPVFTSNRQSVTVDQTVVVNPMIDTPKPSSWWREMPVWAQAAAALLVLGVSAGAANLDVHYDATNGLNIHTGWSKATTANVVNPANPANPSNLANLNPVNLVNRDELVNLESRLRAEIRAAQPAQAMAARASAPV